jgi:hypothetical protein
VPYVLDFGCSMNLKCFADAFNAHNMTSDENICPFLSYYSMKWMARYEHLMQCTITSLIPEVLRHHHADAFDCLFVK